jgi:hypothetical protein
MPSGDIMPFKSPLGGTHEVRHVGMTASQTFLRGHPVGVVDAGTLTGAPSDTTEWLLNDTSDGIGHVAMLGIACWSVGVDDGDGTVSSTARTGFPLPQNPETKAAYTTNDTVAFWPADQGVLFITKNFHDTATTAAVVPAVTDIGEIYQMSTSETAAAGLGWGLEQTAGVVGTDVLAHVVDVLDAKKSPIRLSGNAGVYLVFEIRSTQGVSA